jgi:hypothetical protein
MIEKIGNNGEWVHVKWSTKNGYSIEWVEEYELYFYKPERKVVKEDFISPMPLIEEEPFDFGDAGQF